MRNLRFDTEDAQSKSPRQYYGGGSCFAYLAGARRLCGFRKQSPDFVLGCVQSRSHSRNRVSLIQKQLNGGFQQNLGLVRPGSLFFLDQPPFLFPYGCSSVHLYALPVLSRDAAARTKLVGKVTATRRNSRQCRCFLLRPGLLAELPHYSFYAL